MTHTSTVKVTWDGNGKHTSKRTSVTWFRDSRYHVTETTSSERIVSMSVTTKRKQVSAKLGAQQPQRERKWNRNTSHLSSYQLTNHVIPQQVNRYQQAAKDASRGCEGTLQTDGWTGVNFHHLVAFMVTTVRCKVSNIYYCTCKRAEDYLSICRPILLGLWMSLLIGEQLSI